VFSQVNNVDKNGLRQGLWVEVPDFYVDYFPKKRFVFNLFQMNQPFFEQIDTSYLFRHPELIGRIFIRSNYINDTLNGKYEYYLNDSILMLSGSFSKGLEIGEFVVYSYDHITGTSRDFYSSNFFKGELHGLSVLYDRNELNEISYRSFSEFNKGELHGINLDLYSGNRKSIRRYFLSKNGKFISGRYLEYYENGAVFRSSYFKRNPRIKLAYKKEGRSYLYSKLGKLHFVELWRKDTLKKIKSTLDNKWYKRPFDSMPSTTRDLYYDAVRGLILD
jgi:antitoxin component YwqK of YwqJK toxin-antitoxin module